MLKSIREQAHTRVTLPRERKQTVRRIWRNTLPLRVAHEDGNEIFKEVERVINHIDDVEILRNRKHAEEVSKIIMEIHKEIPWDKIPIEDRRRYLRRMLLLAALGPLAMGEDLKRTLEKQGKLQKRIPHTPSQSSEH